TSAFDLRGPSVAAESADKTPQGRRTGMCGVFRRGRMPLRKIPPASRTRRNAPGAEAGCVSLRQVSLHKQRKVARALSARNALDPVLPLCARGASPGGLTKSEAKNQERINSFRAEARVTFVLAKVTKTAVARRDPDRLRRSGPLRFSDGGARGPNSLRSDKGRSSAPPSCDARLALWLQGQRRRATATAKAKTTTTATATATAADQQNCDGCLAYASACLPWFAAPACSRWREQVPQGQRAAARTGLPGNRRRPASALAGCSSRTVRAVRPVR